MRSAAAGADDTGKVFVAGTCGDRLGCCFRRLGASVALWPPPGRAAWISGLLLVPCVGHMSGRACLSGGGSASEPRVNQVQFIGAEVEALTTAACDNEVSETATEEHGRSALVEPGIGFAHNFKDEAGVVAAQFETT